VDVTVTPGKRPKREAAGRRSSAEREPQRESKASGWVPAASMTRLAASVFRRLGVLDEDLRGHDAHLVQAAGTASRISIEPASGGVTMAAVPMAASTQK
jgi:hypothetical protein